MSARAKESSKGEKLELLFGAVGGRQTKFCGHGDFCLEEILQGREHIF